MRGQRINYIIVDDMDTENPVQLKPCKHNPRLKCAWPVYCENYKCDNTDITPENCDHKDTSIVVLEVVVNCEKTALQCDYCGTILIEPKTECR
jgi:hypothetical protein